MPNSKPIPRTPILRPSRAFLLIAFGLLRLVGASNADEAAEQNAREAARVAELSEIRAQIDVLQTKLTGLRGREATLEDQVRSLSTELSLQETKLAEAVAALDLATARAAAVEVRVGELEEDLSAVRKDLGERLGGLYRLGRQGYLRLFLSAKPHSDLLPAIRQLRFLARRDQRNLERYRTARDELALQRDRLARERERIDEWREQEQTRRDELAALRGRHAALLRRVADERKRVAQRTDSLQDKERKLALLIASLAEARPLEGTPIQDFRGALDWPLEGEVLAEFGTRKDPRYNTEVPHRGLDIAAGDEAQIHVVFPGEVLFADHFAGYGEMAVVHHPGRVFTLYSGLRSLQVVKGDMVSLGDVLGTAQDQVYFEIRHENQPEDPRDWLR